MSVISKESIIFCKITIPYQSYKIDSNYEICDLHVSDSPSLVDHQLTRCTNGMTNIITVFFFPLSSKFFLSFIDDDKACLNSELNWTCPGGYIKVHSAKWKTVTNCGRTFMNFEDHDVVMHMKNKCNNKTTCVFTVEDSSFGVSCSETCSNLDYSYTCVSKSLVLHH